MSLQWYPGHMTKARRELAEIVPSQDVVIEVLDARLPHASRNPVIGELAVRTPTLRVLAKADLADPDATKAWLAALSADAGSAAVATSTKAIAEARTKIIAAAKRIARKRGEGKPVRALIAGVPNVGKSTLINVLAGRAVAKTSDRPAVTKQQQRVPIATSGLVVTDTPGIMWPKIEDERGAFALAFAGSIPDTAIDYVIIARYGADIILGRYAALAVARYKLDAVPRSPDGLLEAIGRRRGALGKGGAVELQRAAEIFVHEFRDGVIGRITLELP